MQMNKAAQGIRTSMKWMATDTQNRGSNGKMTGRWGIAEYVPQLKMLAAPQLQLLVTLHKQKFTVVWSSNLLDKDWNPNFYVKFPNLQMLATHSIYIHILNVLAKQNIYG